MVLKDVPVSYPKSNVVASINRHHFLVELFSAEAQNVPMGESVRGVIPGDAMQIPINFHQKDDPEAYDSSPEGDLFNFHPAGFSQVNDPLFFRHRRKVSGSRSHGKNLSGGEGTEAKIESGVLRFHNLAVMGEQHSLIVSALQSRLCRVSRVR